MLTRYHVKMPKSWKGPSKVSVRLPVGDGFSFIPFKKNQEDKAAPDYSAKTLWLEDKAAVQLKQLGFDLRKAKQPKPETKQEKPKRETK